MSAYVSYAPILERTAAENTSAQPDAPVIAQVTSSRPRFALATLLRRAASVELALAARLDHRPARRLATA